MSSGSCEAPTLPFNLRERHCMDTTEVTIRRFLAALPSPGYDLGILNDQGMYRLEGASPARVVRMLPYLKYRNAHNAHIYLRPTGESAYTLLDDLTEPTIETLIKTGYGPAAVIETSPGNFQAWLRHTKPLCKELGTLASKTLAARFGGDGGAADWRRFGRVPGFTNRKLKYRNAAGLFPFARLLSHTGSSFTAATDFHRQLHDLQQQMELDSARRRQVFTSLPSRSNRSLSLPRYRESVRFFGRPAAADMAFSVAAVYQGMTEEKIAASLAQNYLSRDQSKTRQAAYIRRTIRKAIQWAT